MRSTHRVPIFAGVLVLVLVACHKVPYTGRLQFNLVPAGIMQGLGRSSYESALAGARVERSGEDVEVLKRVGQRISTVANQPDFDWSYTMVDRNDLNAWCMPGGFIAFYTGILPVLRHEAGMAFVMGHEVGHAVAHHGAERLSQQLAVVGGLSALELYLAGGTDLDPKQRAIVLSALGLGAEVGVLLPFSRTHESEADVIGLMYMARAGYPPEESIHLWNRMERASPSSIPSFLATHPTNESRKQNLREWMPRANKRFQRNALPVAEVTEPLWGPVRREVSAGDTIDVGVAIDHAGE